MLRSFRAMYGLDYVALRYFNVYGPRMDVHGLYTEVLVRWMERIADGQPPLIFGDGAADDGLRLHRRHRPRQHPGRGQRRHRGRLQHRQRRPRPACSSLAEALLRAMDSDLPVEHGPERAVNGVVRRLADTSAARRDLGFAAQVPSGGRSAPTGRVVGAAARGDRGGAGGEYAVTGIGGLGSNTGALAVARRRAIQLAEIARSGSLHEVRQRLARHAYARSGAVELEFPLLPEDVTDSSSTDWVLPASDPSRGSPLTVAWAMTPPVPGSGGHTTNFRMVHALEEAGHRCIIHLYDRYGSPIDYHTNVIRQHWPQLRARVVDARKGLEHADTYIATSWQSAHVIGKHTSMPGRRLYFVQDYEPYFYPRGSEYALADDTYRFGFRTIALGGMVADILRSHHGIPVERIPFGTDLSTYRFTNAGPRNGVVFYAKPGIPRRGCALAMAALDAFHGRHPDQRIQLFGDPRIRPPFPARVHGTVSPAELANLYNDSIAGLAISFTNISLVPYEMLACGTIPVVNSDPYARNELANPAVRWAPATPSAMASELSAAVSRPDIAEGARHAAAAVSNQDWREAQRAFVTIVENEAYGEGADASAVDATMDVIPTRRRGDEK